ncbi:hypothetical protein HAX54_024545 [Datura stramonium]|uniref:Uncharacterized protein n=1 Tax=Datura stramonium TaxID=4076 RepID=A0ABS8S7D4_DATST|nr:hypothetical protein [Datura stramonium]
MAGLNRTELHYVGHRIALLVAGLGLRSGVEDRGLGVEVGFESHIGYHSRGQGRVSRFRSGVRVVCWYRDRCRGRGRYRESTLGSCVESRVKAEIWVLGPESGVEVNVGVRQ